MGSHTIKRIGALILMILLAISLVGCDITIVNPVQHPNVSENEQVNIVYSILEQYYYLELPLDLRQIETVEELLTYVDPYTLIYEAGSTSIEREDHYEGLGISITDHVEGLLITDINYYIDIDEKIFVGDIITTVNDTSLAGLEFTDKTLILKGQLGEEKDLKVKRLNETISITLEIIDVPFNSIIYDVFGRIGYIKINRFGRDTTNYFKQALYALEEDNIEGLIIDVRDNGGGYLNVAYSILNEFIGGTDPMFYTYDVKDDNLSPYFPKNSAQGKSYPLTILINQNSASASEVIAGVFQKKGYKLFGERTYGKDLYQVGLRLPEEHFAANMILNLTNGYWLLTENETVAGGLIPDIPFSDLGIKALPYPVLQKEYKKGESNPYIFTYQYLVSLEVDGAYNAGYFDNNFEIMLFEYQNIKGLSQTGFLDEQTMMSLINQYRQIKKDTTYDNMLNEAVNYMETGLNGN